MNQSTFSLTIQVAKEIRLLIYDCITLSLSSSTHPATLQDYQGLLLSSKQTYHEFQAQYLYTFDHSLREVRKAWPFDSPIEIHTPESLQDTYNTYIHIPDLTSSFQRLLISSELQHFFTVLVSRLHSCTLIPDPMQCKNDNTKMKALEKLQMLVWESLKLHKHVSLGNRRQWTPECLCVVSAKDRNEHETVRVCRLYLRLQDDREGRSFLWGFQIKSSMWCNVL